MISLFHAKLALPISWLVVKECKGHLPEEIHLDLLAQVQAILPTNAQALFVGDGNFKKVPSKFSPGLG